MQINAKFALFYFIARCDIISRMETTIAFDAQNASEGVMNKVSVRTTFEPPDVAITEAILFMETNGVSIKTLSALLGVDEEVATQALSALKSRLESSNAGLCVLAINGKYLMAPEKTAWDRISAHYSKRTGAFLSKSALETLAIVAYSQPVTRSKIETLRGVNVDAMVRLLLEKGFIEEVGKSEELGKPTLYGTTKGFLTAFGLSSISDLPKLDETETQRFELAR